MAFVKKAPRIPSHLAGKDLDQVYVVAQCEEWHSLLKGAYNSILPSARMHDALAGGSSMAIIVLNVLLVGKDELNLWDYAASVSVVFMTLVKALQLQFRFAAVACELHDALVKVREALVKVHDEKHRGKFNMADTTSFHTTSEQVHAALSEIPSYVCLKENTYHEIFQNEVTKENAARKDDVLQAIEANAQKLSDQKPMPDPDLPQEGSVAPVAGNPTKGEQSLTAAGTSGPGAELAQKVEAQPEEVPKEELSPDAFLLKKKINVEINILKQIKSSVGGGLRGVWWTCVMSSILAVGQTILELTLNALVMAYNSIPQLKESSSAGGLVAILAATNGVVKGIDMKLKFEVMRSVAKDTLKDFKELKVKVDGKLDDLDMMKQDVNEQPASALENDMVLEDIKEGFQVLVNKYASSLPIS